MSEIRSADKVPLKTLALRSKLLHVTIYVFSTFSIAMTEILISNHSPRTTQIFGTALERWYVY